MDVSLKPNVEEVLLSKDPIADIIYCYYISRAKGLEGTLTGPHILFVIVGFLDNIYIMQ